MAACKKAFLILFVLLLWKGEENSFAQNLVPNPSFEQHDTCPYDLKQIYFANPWFQPNTFADGVCYFNACATLSSVSVPTNFGGFQLAKTGFAYAGIGWLVFDGGEDCGREYLEVELESPLEATKSYKVAFYVNLINHSKYATNQVGVYFSQDSLLYSDSLFHYLEIIPQIGNDSDNIIKDTLNWVLISKTFIAQGGERFMTIGNFSADSASAIDTVNSSGNNWAGYYIDDISVTEDTTIGVNEKKTAIVISDIFPNPAQDEINLNFASLKNVPGTVELFDILGSILTTQELQQGNNRIPLPAAKFPDGIYLYRIKMDEELVIGRFIVTR